LLALTALFFSDAGAAVVVFSTVSLVALVFVAIM
jgi:hypothetical protein